MATKGRAGRVRIREFVPSDRPFLERALLADLREAAPFDPLRMFFPPTNWGRRYSTALLREVRKRGGYVLVAEFDRTRAGFVAGVLEPVTRRRGRTFAAARPCWIWDLYVDPRFRKRGVGTELMNEIEGRFRAKGRDFVHLLALSGNVRAVAMYRSRGYTPRVYMLGKWLVKPSKADSPAGESARFPRGP
jgi:ribosomal protein S18 acetylase RimI-like enzyme